MPKTDGAIAQNDLDHFREGTHLKLAEILGAHLSGDGDGARFSVWAPHAKSVSVIGTFNGWQGATNRLERGGAGIWYGSVAGAKRGARYKYQVEAEDGALRDKADPFGIFHDAPPGNASVIWDLEYRWNDDHWMADRGTANSLAAPMSIYEVHLGSWRRAAKKGEALTYFEIAGELTEYLKGMGFTHVQFLPVMEHPFYGSWGYQTTGYFAPTSRYGAPQDFMHLVDQLHQNGIGVILDWVPSHFPQDEHGLGFFDGVHEYEEADPKRSLHPDWNSFIFNYARGEVRSFLSSSALFWLEKYHADGLRVDAVASMLYLDYSRKPGEWIPNEYGGRENLDAIGYLRRLNEDIYRLHPDVETIAEESTAWPMVSRPTHIGGLGFGMKWDMGWMHDTLEYLLQDPIFRRHHHQRLTFRSVYAFNENFVLPLSHDEVVYGKGSLLAKMPGDDEQKFASVRLLFGYMYAQPGKKLLFMGGEFAQRNEWHHEASLDWNLLEVKAHAGVRLLIGDLNHLYREQPALYANENEQRSFRWIDADSRDENIVSFLRTGSTPEQMIAIVCNFSAVSRNNYRLGVPQKGCWQELMNTNAKQYGGDGSGNFGGTTTVPVPAHAQAQSLTVDVPPLTALYFRFVPKAN